MEKIKKKVRAILEWFSIGVEILGALVLIYGGLSDRLSMTFYNSTVMDWYGAGISIFCLGLIFSIFLKNSRLRELEELLLTK